MVVSSFQYHLLENWPNLSLGKFPIAELNTNKKTPITITNNRKHYQCSNPLDQLGAGNNPKVITGFLTMRELPTAPSPKIRLADCRSNFPMLMFVRQTAWPPLVNNTAVTYLLRDRAETQKDSGNHRTLKTKYKTHRVLLRSVF